MEHVVPDSTLPASSVDTPSVQDLAEDLLSRPKKKRLLSEKQREVLRKGREHRWMTKKGQITTGEDTEEPPPSLATEKLANPPLPEIRDERLQALLNPNSSSSESESSCESTDVEGSVTQRKRKAKKLVKSIPKPIRRRLDKYVKMKMQDVKSLAQQERTIREEEESYPPVPILQRHPKMYKKYGPDSDFDYGLSFL